MNSFVIFNVNVSFRTWARPVSRWQKTKLFSPATQKLNQGNKCFAVHVPFPGFNEFCAAATTVLLVMTGLRIGTVTWFLLRISHEDKLCQAGQVKHRHTC